MRWLITPELMLQWIIGAHHVEADGDRIRMTTGNSVGGTVQAHTFTGETLARDPRRLVRRYTLDGARTGPVPLGAPDGVYERTLTYEIAARWSVASSPARWSPRSRAFRRPRSGRARGPRSGRCVARSNAYGSAPSSDEPDCCAARATRARSPSRSSRLVRLRSHGGRRTGVRSRASLFPPGVLPAGRSRCSWERRWADRLRARP
jgi:hypothetical protein